MEYIDKQFQLLSHYGADFIRLSNHCSVLDSQSVLSTKSILRVDVLSNDPDDREHVGSIFFSKYHQSFHVIGLNVPCKFSKYSFRTCVDELPDYKVMCQLYDSLFNGCPLDFDEAVDWLNGHSDVLKTQSPCTAFCCESKSH